MLRGGVVYLAAPLFSGLLGPVAAHAQAPVRTRDASFAVVSYDRGPTAGALTLYDAIVVANERTSRAGFSLLTIFGDGRLSMQGGLEAARRSAAIPLIPQLARFVTAVRGEVSVDATSTIQTGYMPTAAMAGRARVRLERNDQGGHAEAGVSRAFDGRVWQTVLMGEARAWMRRGGLLASLRTTPMQLGVGDVLVDHEGLVEWFAGRSIVTASLGVRLGEAERGTRGWGAFSLGWPIFVDAYATASLGRYPADLIQNLPAGQYLSFGLRLPNGRMPTMRRPPLPPPPPPPRTPDLPITVRLALVTGPAFDSTNIREVKVWAPGARVVELMGDFVDWLPVPLIRQPNGEWRGYYHITPGLHRVNIRIDGTDIDAPVNWPVDKDEFLGSVALVLVR
jgi:hypothetical protein